MADAKREARGEEIFEQVYGGAVPLPPAGERDDFLRVMLEQLFAEIWSRGELSMRDRRLLIMGAIAALGERELFALQAKVAVEKEEANLSLSSLDRLAAALGVPLSETLRPPGSPDSRRIEALAWRGAQPESRGVLLGSAPASRETELWLWALGEGERYPSEADSGNWHEMLLVIDGKTVLVKAPPKN
jgi:alkylhydroperoxidase/carboxymuconolactone decarboxylase family protein YurZ